MLLALGSRGWPRGRRRWNMHTVATNVPGPQQPLQHARPAHARVVPVRPGRRPVRIVVAIFSYDGGLYFGVTGDYDSAPDIDVLTAGIERAMDELLALVPAREASEAP